MSFLRELRVSVVCAIKKHPLTVAPFTYYTNVSKYYVESCACGHRVVRGVQTK